MKITKKKTEAKTDETKEVKAKPTKADTKPAKTEKAAPAEKATKEAAPEFKYGVGDLAEKLGIKPASVRVALRNHSVKKAGRSYGWNTKTELDEIVSKIKADAKATDKPAKGKKEKEAA